MEQILYVHVQNILFFGFFVNDNYKGKYTFFKQFFRLLTIFYFMIGDPYFI